MGVAGKHTPSYSRGSSDEMYLAVRLSLGGHERDANVGDAAFTDEEREETADPSPTPDESSDFELQHTR